jgi:hypothetical protein
MHGGFRGLAPSLFFVLPEQIIVVKTYNVKDYKIGRILERATTTIEFDIVISSL